MIYSSEDIFEAFQVIYADQGIQESPRRAESSHRYLQQTLNNLIYEFCLKQPLFKMTYKYNYVERLEALYRESVQFDRKPDRNLYDIVFEPIHVTESVRNLEDFYTANSEYWNFFYDHRNSFYPIVTYRYGSTFGQDKHTYESLYQELKTLAQQATFTDSKLTYATWKSWGYHLKKNYEWELIDDHLWCSFDTFKCPIYLVQHAKLLDLLRHDLLDMHFKRKRTEKGEIERLNYNMEMMKKCVLRYM